MRRQSLLIALVGMTSTGTRAFSPSRSREVVMIREHATFQVARHGSVGLRARVRKQATQRLREHPESAIRTSKVKINGDVVCCLIARHALASSAALRSDASVMVVRLVTDPVPHDGGDNSQ